MRKYDMRRLLHFAVAFVSVFLTPVALGTESTASKADIVQLTSLGCEMGRAYARQDLAVLDKLNAEDYVQTDTRGMVVARADYLEYVRQRTAEYVKNGASTLSIDCDNIEVRLYGDAAVVTGGWTYIMQRSEGNVLKHSRWTTMWTRYPTGWKRHVFQNTWVNTDANQPTPDPAATKSSCGADVASSDAASQESPSPKAKH
jgi:ketosteroid isomerase-like protein